MGRRLKRQQIRKTVNENDHCSPALAAPAAVSPARGVQSEPRPVANNPVRESSRRNWEIAGIGVLLAVLVFLVYGQTIRFEFVYYDDQFYVYQNPHVIGGLSLAGITQAFTRKEGGLWTPLVTVSHMLDCQLYGLNAGGHHLTNVLLHAASSILLFLILRQMTGALWRSAFVAAVFSIHPLRVESVAWIAERKDVLSGLFFMLTLWAYLQYVRRPGSVGRYLVVIFLFALGLMCKPMVVTLPFVLLLLDYWPLNRLFALSQVRSDSSKWGSVKWRVLLEKIPLLALSCGLCVATMLGPKEVASVDVEQVPFWIRMGEAPASFVIYLWQMIWPAGLAVIYPHPEAGLPWWPAALALLGVLSFGIFNSRGKHPYLWMGWLWNLGMLLPVSGIVQISRHTRADHYNYLPQIGIYIGLTWAMADWIESRRSLRPVLGGIVAVAFCLLSAIAFQQASYWRNSVTLWTHTLECTDDNCIAHNYLGNVLVGQGRVDEAIAHYREALRIDPAYVGAHSNLGNVLAGQGWADEAIAQYREALQLDPTYAVAHNNLGNSLAGQGKADEAIAQYREALRIDPTYVDAHFDLGNALFRQGRVEEALAEYREALRINPTYAAAHYNLGLALFRRGKSEEAIAQYREALRINPSDADAHTDLGNALLQQGRTGEAIEEMQKAIDIQPAVAVHQNNLAWILATARQASLRDAPKAIQLAMKAVQISGGNNPAILRTLAVAYAGMGDFSNAVQTAQNALHLAEAQSNTILADALRREIKLYEAGHPYEDAH